MSRGGRYSAGDLRGIGVTEIDAAAERNRGEKQTEVRDDGLGHGRVRGVNAEREHYHDASGAGSDGKGEGIEGFLLQSADLGRGDGGNGFGSVGLILAGCAVLLVQKRPANHGDDNSSG